MTNIRLVGKLLGKTRVPRWTFNEVKWKEDRVTNPNMPGLKELGVATTPFEASALQTIFHYRKASHAGELLSEDANHELESIFKSTTIEGVREKY